MVYEFHPDLARFGGAFLPGHPSACSEGLRSAVARCLLEAIPPLLGPSPPSELSGGAFLQCQPAQFVCSACAMARVSRASPGGLYTTGAAISPTSAKSCRV